MAPDERPYLVFTVGHPEADALEKYRQHFGQEPAGMKTWYGYLWLGPVPENGSQLADEVAQLREHHDWEERELLKTCGCCGTD